MFDGKRYPSIFEVWTDQYDEGRYVRHCWAFKNIKDAEKKFVEVNLGDDIPEAKLLYKEHPGCYRQRTIPLRDKSIAYDFDGKMIKIERRRLYEQV